MGSNKEENVQTHQSQAHVDENLAMDASSQFSVDYVKIIIINVA